MISCLNCGTMTQNPKFCSRSCAVSLNNRISPKRRPEGTCTFCKAAIPTSNRSGRCHPCGTSYGRLMSREGKVNLWLSGEWDGNTSSGLSDHIRNHLLEEAGFACQECSYNTRHPDDGRPILEIEHINGNGMDNRPENLKVLCPNCHALTSTYRGRNRGNGRPSRYSKKIIPIESNFKEVRDAAMKRELNPDT